MESKHQKFFNARVFRTRHFNEEIASKNLTEKDSDYQTILNDSRKRLYENKVKMISFQAQWI